MAAPYDESGAKSGSGAYPAWKYWDASDIPISPGPHSAMPIPGTARISWQLARPRVFSIFTASSSSPAGLSGQGSAFARYSARADPWPLNPAGELLLLAVKIENKRGLASGHDILAVPGVGMAEWGPGDMGMSLAPRYFRAGYAPDPDFAHDPPYGAAMRESWRVVREACLANRVALYRTMRPEDRRARYASGVRSSSVTARTDAFLDELRRLAGRTMPW